MGKRKVCSYIDAASLAFLALLIFTKSRKPFVISKLTGKLCSPVGFTANKTMFASSTIAAMISTKLMSLSKFIRSGYKSQNSRIILKAQNDINQKKPWGSGLAET